MSSRTDLVKMGQYIAYLRKEKGYTQTVLADKLDVSDKLISKWETGVSAPDITVLVEIANVLGVTVDEILGGEKTTNIKLKNSLTVDGIKLYIHYSKRKLLKIFLCIILFLIISFSFVLYVNNCYKWNITNIESNDKKYFISGSYIFNKDKEIFIVDKIHYQSNDIGTDKEIKIKKLSISLHKGDVNLISREEEYKEEVYLHESLKYMYLKYEGEIVENTDNNLYVLINYIDENNENYNYIVSLI